MQRIYSTYYDKAGQAHEMQIGMAVPQSDGTTRLYFVALPLDGVATVREKAGAPEDQDNE